MTMHWADYVGMAIAALFLLAAIGHLINMFTKPGWFKSFLSAIGTALFGIFLGVGFSVYFSPEKSSTSQLANQAIPNSQSKKASSDEAHRTLKDAKAESVEDVSSAQAAEKLLPLFTESRVIARAKKYFGKKIAYIRKRDFGDGQTLLEIFIRRAPDKEEKIFFKEDTENYGWRLEAIYPKDRSSVNIRVTKEPIIAFAYSMRDFLMPMYRWAAIIFGDYKPSFINDVNADPYPFMAGHAMGALYRGKPSAPNSVPILAVPTIKDPAGGTVEVTVRITK